MAKHKIEAPENKTLGLEMEAKAVTLAARLNDVVMTEVDRLNVAKQDWEGGSFEVMNKIAHTLTKAERDDLPDPNIDTGNNPAHYLVSVTRVNAKGKNVTEWKERYYYKELTLNLPGVVAKKKLKDQIERSMGADDKVNKSDVPDFVLKWSPDYRRAQITKLTNEINGAVSSVVKAFELFFQLKRFNELLPHVSASPVFALGPDGTELDGQDNRPFKVEATTTPIIVRTTVPSRVLHDVEALSISSFLKVDVDKALELGGTFEAVKTTLKRAKPDESNGAGGTGNAQDQSRPQAVNTADTAIARIVDVAEYTTRAMEARDKAAWEQLKKELSGAGSDEAFLSARDLLQALTVLVGSPADAARDAKIRGEQVAA